MKMKKVIKMTFKRATKSTYRFSDETEGSSILRNLFIKKSIFEGKNPLEITFTIEWEETNSV